MKINLWQYIIPLEGYYNRTNTYTSFCNHFNNSTCYYRCLSSRRRPCSFWVIFIKSWRDLEKVVKLVRRDGKAVEALLAIVGSVTDIILSDLDKTVGFVAKNTWAFMVVIVGSIGISLIQNVKNQKIHR